MKVLVTGAEGQVGRELMTSFDGDDVIGVGRRQLDVTDRDQVRAALVELAPDVVVNAAAWTDVDGCESDVDRAYRANALAVRHLAEGCRAIRASLCQISTDYVFDGMKPSPYVEWDEPNPLSVYGRSKLAGEHEAGDGALVVRTSWVAGRTGSNVVRTVLRLAQEREPLRFVDDQHGNPTFADDLAGVVARLVRERRAGCFHVTNSGPTTWYELARETLRLAGQDPDRVEPVPSSSFPRPAPRPANSVLDNAALRLSGLPPLDHFGVPLARLVGALCDVDPAGPGAQVPAT